MADISIRLCVHIGDPIEMHAAPIYAGIGPEVTAVRPSELNALQVCQECSAVKIL